MRCLGTHSHLSFSPCVFPLPFLVSTAQSLPHVKTPIRKPWLVLRNDIVLCLGKSEAYSLSVTWLRCSPVMAFIGPGWRWSNNTSLTFVGLHGKRAMGMPVWRLHLLCIMMNTDPGIISFRWIKTILKAFCVQRQGFTGPG